MARMRIALAVATLCACGCVGLVGGDTPVNDGGADAASSEPSDSGVATQDAGTASGTDAAVADAGATLIDAGPLPRRDAGPRPTYDAGPTVIVDFLADMPPNSWREVPSSFMSTVCPDINHYPCESVVTAWGGGAYDSVRDRLIIYGGGHGDSFVNSVFTFDVGALKWSRQSDLPPALENGAGGDVPAIYLDKRVETCGLYPSVTALNIPNEWLTGSGYVMKDKCDDPSIAAQLDPQQPRSTHTYGNVAFSQATKQFYTLGACAMYPSGQATSNRNDAFDFDTGLWSRKADNPHITIGAASTTDARGHIYYFAPYGAYEYDPVADAWSTLPGSSDTDSYYGGAAVDTVRNRMILTRDALHLQTFKLSQPDAGRIATTATGLPAALPSQLAFEYDSKLDRYFAWVGGMTTYWLNPATEAWVALEADSNEDNPGGMPVNGCFGKLRYSAKYDVFVLVSAANKNVVLYKPPTNAP